MGNTQKSLKKPYRTKPFTDKKKKKETQILAPPNSISNVVILLSNYIRTIVCLHLSKFL